MGYQLRREVRDLMPRGGLLTDKEARLVLELADNCHERTRKGWPGVEWLAAAADIPNPKRVGEFFNSIARKWVELRVEIGKDKNGKPYYAKSGHKTVYRIPTRAELIAILGPGGVPTAEELGPVQVPPTEGPEDAQVPATGGPEVPALGGPQVPATGGAQVPALGGPFSSKIYSKISSSSSSATEPAPPPALGPETREEEDEKGNSQKPEPPIVAEIAEALEIGPIEAEQIRLRVIRERNPDAPARYIRSLIASGDLKARYGAADKPAEPWTGPRCDFHEDPRIPGSCTCGFPKANRRHQQAA